MIDEITFESMFGDFEDVYKLRRDDGLYKKKYNNRYWVKNDNAFELHFMQYGEDKIILKFIPDEKNSENYTYVSELLNVEYDEIFADSVQNAMEQFEDMIEEFIQKRINYYGDMLVTFNEID